MESLGRVQPRCSGPGGDVPRVRCWGAEAWPVSDPPLAPHWAPLVVGGARSSLHSAAVVRTKPEAVKGTGAFSLWLSGLCPGSVFGPAVGSASVPAALCGHVRVCVCVSCIVSAWRQVATQQTATWNQCAPAAQLEEGPGRPWPRSSPLRKPSVI